MLGQDLPYTDPDSGYTVQSDTQAYRDTSVALVDADRYLAALTALQNAYQAYFAQTQAQGFDVDPQILTDNADVLTAMDDAAQKQATLQDFVNRYRIQYLGSGQVSGLGVLPLLVVAVAVGISALAAALGYFLYKHYDVTAAQTRLQTELTRYQQWIGQQVSAGTLDPQTGQALAADAAQTAAGVAATGGFSLAGLFSGGAGLLVVGAVVVLVLATGRRA
jgi:hypothetical protein